MKPGSYTQLYVQLVFAVQYRKALLIKEIRPRVFEYMSGIASNLGHKSIIVNGVSDHVHVFIGLNPKISISDTVFDLKRSTSLFINEEKLSNFHFSWQDGYGAFSYSRSSLENVYRYIENQEEHHRKNSFRKEYVKYLKDFDIEYDKRFLFEFFE